MLCRQEDIILGDYDLPLTSKKALDASNCNLKSLHLLRWSAHRNLLELWNPAFQSMSNSQKSLC